MSSKLNDTEFGYSKCPECGAEDISYCEEDWDPFENIETRWCECEHGHKWTETVKYEPKVSTVEKGWVERPDHSLQYGRFYIGCTIEGEPVRFYSWDSFGWRFATLEEAKEQFIVFTRMSLKVAKDSIREIREAKEGEYKDLKMFLIPKEDAKLWGIVEVD